MEQTNILIKEQLNRIEFMLIDIKRSTAGIPQPTQNSATTSTTKPLRGKGGKK